MVIFKNKKKKAMQEVEEKQLYLRHFSDLKKLGIEKSSPSSTITTSAPKLKQPLHNFSLPGELRWRNQKLLRCIKVDSSSKQEFLNILDHSGTGNGTNNDGLILGHNFGDGKSGACGGLGLGLGLEDDDCASYYMNCESGLERKLGFEGFEGSDGIDAVREKVILDLRNAADEMKDAILGRGGFEERVQPWNLRTRRAMNRPEGGSGGEVKDLKLDVIKNSVDALRNSGETMSRRRSGAGSPSGVKKEREKFSVALGRREIEEDFMAVVGHKPSRRPKKRAKNVQKKLDTMFPGLWLTEITSDMYKVAETGKDKREG